MKTHFVILPLRFATALCLLLLAAAHTTFGAVTFTGSTVNSTAVGVGVNGIGTLTIDGGSSLSNTNGVVGNIAGSNGTVNVSGGNWTNSGLLRVGGAGTGSLTITNGTVSNTDGTVGNIAGSNGTVNVSGGNWTNSSNLTIGSAGNGTLNLTGNGTVSVGSGLVTLATASGITGTLNLGTGTTVGTLSAATITGGDGTAVVNINQNASYTLGSNMTGSLSLNHLGTGTTTLTGNNTYTGGTTVNAGTLEVATGGSINNTGDLFVGLLSGDNGTLHLNGGSVSNVVHAFVYLGYNVGSVGAAIVSAGNWMNNAGLFVGLEGTGSLTINGTGSVTNSDGYIGDTFGSNGTVSVSGGTWTNNDSLVVGIEGTGSLTINGTGNVTSVNGFVGDQASGNGTVSVSGGAWTNSGDLYVGNFGTGTLNLTGGNVVVGSGSGNITIARETASTGTLNLGTGTTVGTLSAATITGGNGTAVVNINQNGSYTLGSNMTGSLSLNHIGTGTTALTGMNSYAGTTLVKSGTLEVATGGSINDTWDIFVGLLSGDNGTLHLSGGSVSNAVDANVYLGTNFGSVGNAIVSAGNWMNSADLFVGLQGTGSLTINGTGSVTSSDGYIGHGSGSNGTVSVSGGTWSNRSLLIGNQGTGSLTINGTGNVTSSDGYIGNLPGGNGTVSVSGGTWTNSSNLAVGVSGTGSLTINGTGTVIVGATLSRGSNGTINLESGGTLQIGTGVTAGALDTDLVNNGALIFNRSDEYTYNGTISGTGNLTKQGAGMLTLAANNTYSDVTTITGGTLALSSTGQISHSGSDFYAGFGSGDNATLTINGGSLSNSRGFIGYGNGSTGTVNINSGTWTNALNMRVGYYGNGTLNLAGGSISNVNGLIGKYGASTGVANVSGGTWTSSGYMTIGDEATGTLNLTGGNVVVGGGTGNVTIALETTSSGTLNLGIGSTVGTLQAARVTGGNGTSVVNFNHSGNHSFSPIMEGNLSVNKLGSGTTTLSGNNTHAGGTSIQNGTLSVQAPMALGSGNVSLSAGSLLVASGQEMPGSLQIGGHFNWTGGTIAYYDTGASPGSSDMQIVVGGNFTASAGNKTFDFSQVDALNSGNYTLVLAGNVTVNLADLIATHGSSTTLNGTFSSNGTTIVYTVTGATSGGNFIQNVGGPNTPLVADFAVTTSTITVGSTNTIRSLSFSNSAALTINATGQLTITSGNLSVQSGGTSVVSGGTLLAPNGFNKDGAGELKVSNNVLVNGTAAVNAGLLSVNGNFSFNGGSGNISVGGNGTLGGNGSIAGNVLVAGGNLAPGNSPGNLTVAGNLVLTGANSTIIEIAGISDFDKITVTGGQATLGGNMSVVQYNGYQLAYGQRYDILTATGGITGNFSAINMPVEFVNSRGRFLINGTTGTLLIAPLSYVPLALNQNQRNVAAALDTFIPVTSGDRLAVSIALDSQTAGEYPSAFNQIMPGIYESLRNMAIEQSFNQNQLLNQRTSSVRLGVSGFQALGGLSQPLVYDSNGKRADQAKTGPIVENAMATNWNAWVLGTGMFSRTTSTANVQNYDNNAGGFLLGADYRWNENFVTGLYTGYDYSKAKYAGGSSTKGNTFNFGSYASYEKNGYYADGVLGGGFTSYQTKRSIKFSTIDRKAKADPNSGQFTAGANFGKDWKAKQFTFGPVIGAHYTFANIGGFKESGADSLNLAIGQQDAHSLRTTLGGRLAYNWGMNKRITLVPEIRISWMHEFMNNPRDISNKLDGGNGASFNYETTTPYRDSANAGTGVTAQFNKSISSSVFYNVNLGSQSFLSNTISLSLNFGF